MREEAAPATEHVPPSPHKRHDIAGLENAESGGVHWPVPTSAPDNLSFARLAWYLASSLETDGR
jgi:hypothetical protein